tara:strand:+ start:1825 stop:2556 length:732 start_codon:yes stop_codon:yes gene_type:complete
MDLSGKNALITGGAVRVGRAITLALANAGCNVFIHYGHSVTSAEKTTIEAEAAGVRVVPGSADLADAEQVEALISNVIGSLGPLDILINSAATFGEDELADTSVAGWDSQLAINLRAPFILSRDFARRLGDDRPGKIVNIVDARIYRPAGDHFAYRVSKAGLAAMTEMLAQDLAPNITVNAVALGVILAPSGKDPSFLEDLAATRVPLQRPGNVEMVADNVLHLLRSDFLTGVIVRLDGGEFL